jgi:SAM-dependent methyltransferase
VLKKKGASFCPAKVLDTYMNTTLKSKGEWQSAIHKVKIAGLHVHPDDPKNWDSLAALGFILKHTKKSSRILDAGGEVYSPLVEWLFLYGYKYLHVVNLLFNQDFSRGPIKYIRGDCTKTPYPPEYFDVITSLSVIEHGVETESFLRESHRILRSGGLLIISTDYWSSLITTFKEAYGTNVRIFTQEEIQILIDRAREIGFMLTGKIDYKTEEKAVRWKRLDLDFTFIIFTLVKK